MNNNENHPKYQNLRFLFFIEQSPIIIIIKYVL
jgi:hypothetical protein